MGGLYQALIFSPRDFDGQPQSQYHRVAARGHGGACPEAISSQFFDENQKCVPIVIHQTPQFWCSPLPPLNPNLRLAPYENENKNKNYF